MSETTQDIFASLDADLRAKLDDCQARLKALGRVIVAFSGGVDSTLLLALALRVLGRENVLAVVAIRASLPQRELTDARELIALLGARGEFLTTDEMDDPRFHENPENRCYVCKNDLFRRLLALADEDGYKAVCSGANADDTEDFRPGLDAAEQLGIRSPLMAAGLTKDDIRRASRAMDLPTWDKPAYACLATRIPYGQSISAEKLKRIEQGEDLLHSLGFRQCRLRDHGDTARIEVDADRIADLLAHRETIVAALTEMGFAYVTVDLRGFRSGSLNETLSS